MALLQKHKHQNRVSKLIGHLHASPTSAESEYISDYRQKLRECRKDLIAFIDKINCNPILVRLAWHDSGTYDRTIGVNHFPQCGGANGSIRFEKELSHGANAGLSKAIKYLKTFKDKYPSISWSDLIQLASVTAIEHSGGPVIPIRFGRVDTQSAEQCPPEGNLPDANAPFANGRDANAAVHLRRVFYRMGFNDQEIVALSGAHTLGRAFKERSGTTQHGYGDKSASKFTKSGCVGVRADGGKGVGMSGGMSWTKKWLTFNEKYFHKESSEYMDDELLVLSTDKVLHLDQEFKKYVKKYGSDQNLFFDDYTNAHRKLSECGSLFRPKQGFYL